MVAPGNPLGLNSIADLARKRARYVNRALGTGTRLLFDDLLAQSRLAPADVDGYTRTEPSHAAVAHAVASGAADAGLGIEAAARSRGLQFVPLLKEDYYLVCLKAALAEPAVQALLDVLRSDEWRRQVTALPGYEPGASGQILSLRAQLPWWQFPARKTEIR